jgi:N-acetylglucosamine-6-phosphate deacetylase
MVDVLTFRKHLKTTKHKSSLEIAASSSSSRQLKRDVIDEDFTVAANEATFTYHTAIHGLSFKASHCTSKLIPKRFETKFGIARSCSCKY